MKIGKFPFTAVPKARIEDATDGFVKIVASEADGEILGLHMIGSGVTELIGEGVTAMGLEGAVADMAEQHLRVARHAKLEGSPEIHVGEVRGAHSREPCVLECPT